MVTRFEAKDYVFDGAKLRTNRAIFSIDGLEIWQYLFEAICNLHAAAPPLLPNCSLTPTGLSSTATAIYAATEPP